MDCCLCSFRLCFYVLYSTAFLLCEPLVSLALFCDTLFSYSFVCTRVQYALFAYDDNPYCTVLRRPIIRRVSISRNAIRWCSAAAAATTTTITRDQRDAGVSASARHPSRSRQCQRTCSSSSRPCRPAPLRSSSPARVHCRHATSLSQLSPAPAPSRPSPIPSPCRHPFNSQPFPKPDPRSPTSSLPPPTGTSTNSSINALIYSVVDLQSIHDRCHKR